MSDAEAAKALEWKEIGERIQKALDTRGWTHKQLAEMLGTAKSDVTQTIGGRAVSEEKLARFAEALGVSRPYLRYGITDTADAKEIEAAAFLRGHQQALDDVIANLQQLRARPMAARLLTMASPMTDAGRDTPSADEKLEQTLAPFASEIQLARAADDPGRLQQASRRFYDVVYEHVVAWGKSPETAAYLADLLLSANGGTLSVQAYRMTERPAEDGQESPRIKRR